MEHMPHSQISDEPRFVSIVSSLIDDGTLKSTSKWKKTSTDEAARGKRRRAADRAAKEAEKAAKELGVWDEFYGSGSKGKRQGDKAAKDDSEGALQALIVKRQREREGGLAALEEKYKLIEEEERARKRAKKEKGSGKKGLVEIDDAGEDVPVSTGR